MGEVTAEQRMQAALDIGKIQRQLGEAVLRGGHPDLAKAYVAFWGSVGNVEKNAKNPHLKNRYADLEAVLNHVKPKLVEHKLALLQISGPIVDGTMTMITMLVHESGQAWTFNSGLPMPDSGTDKKTGKVRPPTPQSAGSAISYLRRYITMAICGIAATDDDGEEASRGADEEDGDEEPGDSFDIAAFEAEMRAFKAKGMGKREAVKAFDEKFRADLAKTSKETIALYTALKTKLKEAA